MNTPLNIFIIGAGNVAHHVTRSLRLNKTINITQVFNHRKTANEKNDQISELTSGIVIEKEAKDFESTVEEAKDFQKTMKEELKNSPLENKKTFFAKPETPILKQKTIIEVIKDLKTTQKSLAPKLNFKSSSIPAPKTKSFY